MICKECGAYNPDHATYCKVCAANLKGEPAPEKAEAPVEEQQPTKRFSRPSWVMPEAPERSQEPKPEKAEEPVEEPEAPVEEPVQEEPEENTEVFLFSRGNSRRKPAAEEPEEEENDDEPSEEPVEEPAEEEGIYNDEEALENEDDSFEYEPTPPKRKQQKKKNNTMFTVLLIAIIVVIVGIIVVIAGIFLKDQLGCSKKSTPQQGASEVDNPTVTDPGAVEASDPGTAETPAPAQPDLDAKNAQLLEYRDENNNDMIAITVVVPAKSTLEIEFPHQDDYKFVNEEERDMQRKVKIPVEVFYRNEPLEEAEVTFEPVIKITGADGSSYQVNCPSFTRTFPKLNITVTAPVANEEGVIMAPESNTVTIEATIDDPSAQVTVNGVGTVVYQGGKIMQDFSFPEGASEDDVETITITATKNDCVSDTKEIEIHAYKFVPEAMKLEVKNEGASLHADKSGKLTVTGTTLPGATLTATSDNSTNVLCGSVNVDNDGNFSFQITMDSAFFGMSVITLDAAKEGAESGSTKFTVVKGFADKDAFLKYYNKTKTYIEIPKNIKIDELLANQTQYASNAYGIRITATVGEAIEIDGEQVVKMTLAKSGETVYVRNFSTKWTPGENVGGKYNIYCNFTGTYSDTGCAEFIGWFAKIVK
jgi:hypothetical protein